MRRTWIIIALLALLPLSAYADENADPPSFTATANDSMLGQAQEVALRALSFIGVRYKWGGSSPDSGFDCSGLVSYAHSREGISVPRTAAAQFAAARKVDPAALRTGDLVFFRLVPGSREVTHVGIYTGQRRFVHAPQTGRNVGEASLEDPYYRERFAGAGRLFPEGPGAGPRLKSSPR